MGIKGEIRRLAEVMGEKEPVCTFSDVTISGLPAKTATYRPKDGGLAQALIVRDRREVVWIVMAVGDAQYTAEIERVIASVTVN